MSEQTIVVTVSVADAPQWFVEIVHEGRVKRLQAKVGEPITVPAGAWVSRYGPVILPALTLSSGIVGEEQAQ